MIEFFKNLFDFKDLSGGNLTTVALIIICAALVILIVGSIVAGIILRKMGKGLVITTKDITYGAVCLGAAFAVSFVGIRLPQGGTITPFSVLPIMIYCYYFGLRKGSVVVVAYTLLQFLQNPFIVHPFSAILDYAVPYLALIFLGVFSYSRESYNLCVSKKRKTITAHTRFFIGVACYVIVRYISHVLSGGIFYGEYAQWGLSAWPYSFVYNLYSVIDAALATVMAFGLLSSKSFNTFMASSSYTLQKSNTAKEND